MATFPAIIPTTRLYTQGDYPSAIQQSSNGTTTGYRRGNRRINQTLQLTFDNLTETQKNALNQTTINDLPNILNSNSGVTV